MANSDIRCRDGGGILSWQIKAMVALSIIRCIIESLPSNTVMDKQVDAFQLPVGVLHPNYLTDTLNDYLLLEVILGSTVCDETKEADHSTPTSSKWKEAPCCATCYFLYDFQAAQQTTDPSLGKAASQSLLPRSHLLLPQPWEGPCRLVHYGLLKQMKFFF